MTYGSLFTEKIPRLIDHSWWYKFVFFSLATAIAIIMIGYQFGTFDQASHIPFLKKLVEPTLYPNDPFFTLKDTHYSYFWFLFIPALRLGILEISMFVVYVVFVFLTFVAIYTLSMTLFGDTKAAYYSVLASILPHVGFSGFPIIEFSLVNRLVVFPLALFSINWYLQKKYLWAFVLLGVCFNLHVITVNFVLGMILIDSLFRYKEGGVITFIKYFIVFLLLALPVLLWRLSEQHIIVPFDISWYIAIREGILGHIFDIFRITPPFILFTFSGISSIGIVLFLCFRHYAFRYNRTIIHFVIGIILCIGMQVVLSITTPLVFTIQSQIVRVGVFAFVFSYIYGASTLANVYREKKWVESIERLLLLALPVTPLFFFVDLLVSHHYPRIRCTRYLLIVSVLFTAIIGVVAYSSRMWVPSVQLYTPVSSVTDVQLWVRNHTLRNAMVIAPPYLWWITSVDWRVISERSTVATWSELLEIAFTPSYFPLWKERFSDVAPHSLESFRGDVFTNRAMIRNAYLQLSPEAINKLSEKYNASYFVTEKHKLYPFTMVYENDMYRVYVLK